MTLYSIIAAIVPFPGIILLSVSIPIYAEAKPTQGEQVKLDIKEGKKTLEVEGGERVRRLHPHGPLRMSTFRGWKSPRSWNITSAVLP